MKHLRSVPFSIHLYRALLRLYPAVFRVEYGDEMIAVFQLRLADVQCQSRLRLVAFLLGEAFSLVMNGLKERLAERHTQQLILFGQGELQQPTRFTRICSLTLTVLVALFIWLIFVPFYAYGLHLEPANLVAGGAFDPKCFPVYSAAAGGILRLLSVLIMVITPFSIVGFGSLLGFTVARYWAVIEVRQRWYGLTAVSMGFGLLAFLFSPYGRVIASWFAD